MEAKLGWGTAESARKKLKGRSEQLRAAEAEATGETTPYEKAPDWQEKKGRAEGGKVGTKPSYSNWPGSN